MVLKRTVLSGIKPVVWWFLKRPFLHILMLWARPDGILEGCQNLCPEVQVEDYQLFFFDDICLFECGGSVAWLLLLAH